jgi:hypothetical protein
MRTIIGLILAFAATSATAQIVELRQRCEDDNLNPQQAQGRFQWLKRCHPDVLTDFHDTLFPEYRADPADLKIDILEDEWLYSRGRLRGRPKYLTFGLADNSNPQNWQAPTDKNAACGMPAGYIPLGLCTSSCYHPSQVVLFEQGEVPIGEAFDQVFDRIITLDDGSTLDSLSYKTRPVEAYTESIRDTDHNLVRLTMASGGELLVTPNHPLLKSDGMMVEAQKLQPKDALVTEFGEADPIVAVQSEDYFGKVYNVAPRSDNRTGHILVAQGYLTGSSWYQNDGIDEINRVVLRKNVPDTILPETR